MTRARFRKDHPALSALIEMVAETLLLPVSVVVYGIKDTAPAYKDSMYDLYRVVFNKGQARYYWTQ